MRISITYLYTILRYGYPHGVEATIDGIRHMREAGFRFVELEGLGSEHLNSVYQQRERLLQTLAETGVHVHNFCVVLPDLVSLDEERQRRAMEEFRLGAEVAHLLGTETLHLASCAPPVEYLDEKPYALGADGGYQFAGIPRLHLPPGFDWSAVWQALVRSCRYCADVAAERGRTVIMEPRVGEVICSPDSMLRLIEHVGRPNFKANFDTGHFSAQRENVVLALAKLEGHFANIHISDNIPMNTDHLPVGDGSIDWEEFFRVLQRMNYTGYLGIDLGLGEGLLEGYRKSVARIREITGSLGIPLEV
ncbi:MAG: sugar phosphate isomerase/epimerase [Acidobacteria bacterium]|nr:sugar phosphate isomerase/epimerase [Acidobacteriota bacterium]